MKTVVCKKCGESHECAGRLSNRERARKAGETRWDSPAEKLEAAKTALASAPQPKVARTVKSMVMTPAREVSVEPAKRARPSDMCPHGMEYRFCRMGMCKGVLE